MSYSAPFCPKQVEFIKEANAKYNLAHGSVRSGKTVCSLYKFIERAILCEGESIVIFGYSQGSIKNNVINLLLESQELSKYFKNICSWSSKGVLLIGGRKRIICLGAGDEGTLGTIQGITIDLCYCDEMTLYPNAVIDMIKTRLSRDGSQLYAAMNPKQPSHPCKEWIDLAETDSEYYALHFVMEDNLFLSESYKADMRRSFSGLFYKRNYLGLWCLAEGAVYDFFDPKLHVVNRPPCNAEYYICGVDFGTAAPFCCLIIGVNTGRFTQTGPKWWVEKEYYWNPAVTHRQKTNFELAEDMARFLEPYPIKAIYIDPSCAAFKADLRKMGMHYVDANNDVAFGIQKTSSELYKGSLTILRDCTNLIKEIEGYVWDAKKVEKGEDEPMKGKGIMDHACFCAGTKIGNDSLVEDIEVGDVVRTRNGWQVVIATLERREECFEFEIAGRLVSCTADHPFYTVNDGWKKASDLTQSDILITLEEDCKWENTEKEKWSSGKEERIDDIQMLLLNLKDSILNTMDDISIGIFGKHPMEKHQKDVIYITSTKTPLIMIYPISNVLIHSSMQKDIEILVKMAFQINVGQALFSGINQMQAENGIENTQNLTVLGDGNADHIYARCAGTLIKLQRDLTQNFVQINVNLPGEESLQLTMSLDNALDAMGYLSAIRILKQDSALDSVLQKPIGKQKVYNLSVYNDEEYFAEGLLVSNCDALRYAVASHIIPKQWGGDGRTLGGGFRGI